MKSITIVSAFLAFAMPLHAAGIIAGTPEGEAEIDKLASFAREMEQHLKLVQPDDQDDQVSLAVAIRQCRERQYFKGLPVIQQLASERNPQAVYVLAKMHALGAGVPKLEDKARSLFDLAAKLGNAAALVELGILAEGAGSDEALGLYRQAAEAGEPLANLKLGHCYETKALGVEENKKLAFSYYKKAADAGVPRAQFDLGRCFDAGIGVPPDALKATRLIREAALQGVVPAQLAMAGRYFQGKGTEGDPVAAVGWLTVASQNGSSEAQVLLGDRYENGDAVVRDFKRAGQLYFDAVKQGHNAARQRLAALYIHGKGTEKNLTRAYVLLSQAKGFPPAEQDLQVLKATLTPAQLKEAQAALREVEAGTPAGAE